MMLRAAAAALTIATIVLQTPQTEPRYVAAPCWTPLGRHVVAETGNPFEWPTRVLVATRSRWDPVHLPLPALFIATPIVVQGRVVRLGAPRAEPDGTWLIDAAIAVDEVVKNLSAVRIARGAALRVTVPASYRGVAFAPAAPALTLGRRSVWLLKQTRRGVEYASEGAQAIDVDRTGRLTLQPQLTSFAAGIELAAARDLPGLCARMQPLSGRPLRNEDDLERALLRWAGIDTPARQRVYAAQMRRNADAIALYLFIAKTNFVRAKDRTFPSSLCRSDRDPTPLAPSKPVSCMSYAAMNERINPGGRFIYP